MDFSEIIPFTGESNLPSIPESSNVMADVAMSREVAEVQGAIIVAKKFPRNQVKALDRILIACQRPGLAETALYSYARGGSEITGPSIRLAEALAQNWGNIQFGIRELEQRHGESTVESYAIDLETNTRQSKVFQVKHYRHTKKGGYNLTDPRDIYELVANQGARRLRACILGIIPGDIVESAQTQCEQTLKAKADISPEATKKMVEAFQSFNVSKQQIEVRIQRKIESITAAQVIALRKVYNSLKDGMSKPEDWFEPEQVKQETTKKAKKEAPQAPPQPNQPQANGNGPAEGINGTMGNPSTFISILEGFRETKTPEEFDNCLATYQSAKESMSSGEISAINSAMSVAEERLGM
jgi:hypothetical protein